jgi:hypothetical protein
MPTVPAQPGAVVAWMEVLDRIEQALAESLARAAALDRPAEASGGAVHAVRLALEVLGERQARLQAILDRAGQEAGQADAVLAGAMAGLEKWLQENRAAGENGAVPATGAA